MTEAQLQKRLKYWQKILKLQDWDINIWFADTSNIGNCFGHCEMFTQEKKAIVRIAKKETHDKTTAWAQRFPALYDQERTLVHELLHVRLNAVTKGAEEDSPQHQLEEQAVNALADALLSLDRKGKG